MNKFRLMSEFGFVAKYKKGANVPSDNTEFQFEAGKFHFHSTNYQWLVVAGAKAQFKGEVTVEKSNHNYGFMLTAIDSQNTSKTNTLPRRESKSELESRTDIY